MATLTRSRARKPLAQSRPSFAYDSLNKTVAFSVLDATPLDKRTWYKLELSRVETERAMMFLARAVCYADEADAGQRHALTISKVLRELADRYEQEGA